MRKLSVQIGAGTGISVLLSGILGLSVSWGNSAERYDQRLYNTAISLLRNEKPAQALKTFQELSENFPGSPLADDALYQSGRFNYRPEGIGDLHRTDQATLVRALPYFRKIQKTYSRSDTAPLALYKLGLISLEARNPERDLDEAFATFSRILNLYPTSPVVDRAMFGVAFTQYRMRSFSRAMTQLEELLERFPRSRTATDALYLLAICQALNGQEVAAMESLQLVIDREEDGSWKNRALRLSTLLYRTRFLPQLGKEVVYRPDREFEQATSRAGMRSCADLAVDGDGRVYAADSRQRLLWSFQPDGGLLGRLHRPEGIQWISIRGDRGVLTGNRNMVFLGSGARVIETEEQPVGDIDSVAISREGELFILDRKFREIVKLDPVLEFQSRLYQATSGKLLELRLGPLEDLFLLTGPDPVILLRDQGGEWKEHLAGEESLGSRPEDFAVDGLRNLYVLSDRGGRLRVLSPSGETIALLDVATYSDGSRFLPNRVAADGAGSIYLCNRKGTRIVRYR